MKMRIIGGIAVAIMVSAILPAAALAAPQVLIYTDKGSYQAGDTIEVSLAGENHGEGMSVDVYIGLLTPDGSLYTLGELAWSKALGPWIQDIYLPSQFNMERSPFFWLPLPCEMPPIDQPGELAFMAALMYSATFEFASGISEAPFEVVQVPRDYYVDAELGEDANDGSQDAPWRTITHALGSVDGFELGPVTVHVAAGTYSASTNGETFPLNMKSWGSLVGEGADATILDAASLAPHVIYCREAEASVIEGFTVTGGSVDAEPWPDHDGGIRCDGGSPTIRHNTITGNSAYNGGGIYCYGASPTIAHNTITGNSAEDGGGICSQSDPMPPFAWALPIISSNIISANSARSGGGISCSYDLPTIRNNTITGNSASAGGGICCLYSSAAICGNRIQGNSARGEGGGVYGYRHAILLFENLISDNVAASAGGGAHFWCASASVDGNTIEYNRAGSGGGLYAAATDIIVTNNDIVGNASAASGGGIDSEYTDLVSNNTIALNTAEGRGGGVSCFYATTFNNNTIVGNTAGGLGAGIWSYETSSASDCIIWNQGDDPYNCSATFSCIEDADEGEGNIHDDPRFVHGALGDYYLDRDSPCIDAGSRSAEDAGLSDRTTQTGTIPDTGRVDMGVHYPIPRWFR